MTTLIIWKGRAAILPDSPTAESYVIKLEKRQEENDIALSRTMTEVALQVVDEERREGKLSYSGWRDLNDRVRDIQEWLIDRDRY